jgi:hypothetical protein
MIKKKNKKKRNEKKQNKKEMKLIYPWRNHRCRKNLIPKKRKKAAIKKKNNKKQNEKIPTCEEVANLK